MGSFAVGRAGCEVSDAALREQETRCWCFQTLQQFSDSCFDCGFEECAAFLSHIPAAHNSEYKQSSSKGKKKKKTPLNHAALSFLELSAPAENNVQ